ncbi:hypothetical protein KCU90_g862, partial [Aureobasidium melanogenum]
MQQGPHPAAREHGRIDRDSVREWQCVQRPPRRGQRAFGGLWRRGGEHIGKRRQPRALHVRPVRRQDIAEPLGVEPHLDHRAANLQRRERPADQIVAIHARIGGRGRNLDDEITQAQLDCKEQIVEVVVVRAVRHQRTNLLQPENRGLRKRVHVAAHHHEDGNRRGQQHESVELRQHEKVERKTGEPTGEATAENLPARDGRIRYERKQRTRDRHCDDRARSADPARCKPRRADQQHGHGGTRAGNGRGRAIGRRPGSANQPAQMRGQGLLESVEAARHDLDLFERDHFQRRLVRHDRKQAADQFIDRRERPRIGFRRHPRLQLMQRVNPCERVEKTAVELEKDMVVQANRRVFEHRPAAQTFHPCALADQVEKRVEAADGGRTVEHCVNRVQQVREVAPARRVQRRRDPLRKNHRADHARADHTDHHFAHGEHNVVEYTVGIGPDRHRRDGGAVPGQHESIRLKVAVVRRPEYARADPCR